MPGGIMLLVLIGVSWLCWKLWLQQLLQQGKAGRLKIMLIGLGIVFLALALTGRAPALFAIIGAAMTQIMRLAPLLIRFAPSLARHFGLGGIVGGPGGFGQTAGSAQPGGSSTGQSRVSTRTITMTLDHVSGAVGGAITDSPFKGSDLDALSIDELVELYRWCGEHDPEAQRLVETYASRERSDEWDSDEHYDRSGGGPSGSARSPSSGSMSIADARSILGIDDHATRDDIIAAHRSLMGKLHPDKGGSHFLSTQVNAAKQVLLAAL